MKIWQKILLMGLVIMLFGCGGDKDRNSQSITQKTKEALGDDNKEIGCDNNKSGEECSEDGSSSSFILNTLAKEDNGTTEDEKSLRTQLNNLIEDMQKEETKNSNREDLESLVNQVEELFDKDTDNVAKGLETLVNNYDKENSVGVLRDELESLVEDVENSKLKREEVEAKLLSLVDEAHSKQIKKEEVKEKLLALVGDATQEEKESLKQTQLNLENLVDSAEKKGTKEAKRLASSIIDDVSKRKIKILKTTDTFVVIKVQTGDSLSALAAKYYGDARKYKMIYEANKKKIGNRHTIYPGTTLVIPKLEETTK
ncbi:MAG: LysM peptidoglycan-binding domain-containing protein [Epsilonproteobacteria bacterium]|nr:LysM peptidoglycan-binding domain-containing protein [Campylobacterota bacterium]